MFIEEVHKTLRTPGGVLCVGVDQFCDSARRTLHPAGVRLSNKLVSINIAPRWGASLPWFSDLPNSMAKQGEA
jgi:hypothetical protein